MPDESQIRPDFLGETPCELVVLSCLEEMPNLRPCTLDHPMIIPAEKTKHAVNVTVYSLSVYAKS